MMNSEFSKRKYTNFKVRHQQNDLAKVDHKTNVSESTSTEPTFIEVKDVTRSSSLNSSVAVVQKESTTSTATTKTLKKESKELKSSHFNLTKNFLKKHSKFHNAKQNNKTNTNEVLLVILLLTIPFVAVYLERGMGSEFWIDLLLWIFLVWIGGVIYGFYVCFGSGGSGSRGEGRR